MTPKEFEKWAQAQTMRGMGKPQANAEFIKRMYIPVTVEHISEHGCSGLKCKKCPLKLMCDKDTSKAKELAIKMLAMIKLQGVQNG